MLLGSDFIFLWALSKLLFYDAGSVLDSSCFFCEEFVSFGLLLSRRSKMLRTEVEFGFPCLFCCVIAKWGSWYRLVHRKRFPQTDLVRRLHLEPLISNSSHMSIINRICSFCEFSSL